MTRSTEVVVWSFFITDQHKRVRYKIWRRPYIQATYTGIIDWARVLCRNRCRASVSKRVLVANLSYEKVWFAWKWPCRQNSSLLTCLGRVPRSKTVKTSTENRRSSRLRLPQPARKLTELIFARRLALTLRQKPTRKCPIWCHVPAR